MYGDWLTIRVSKQTRETLESLKIIPRETMDELLNRMIETTLKNQVEDFKKSMQND